MDCATSHENTARGNRRRLLDSHRVNENTFALTHSKLKRMIIINYFLRLTSLSFSRFRSCWTARSSPTEASQDRRNGPNEESALLDRDDADVEQYRSIPSLTSQFEDYARSWSAWKVCLAHATLYYMAAVFGFSYLVERWPIIDSLYLGTVVFN